MTRAPLTPDEAKQSDRFGYSSTCESAAAVRACYPLPGVGRG